MHYKKINNLILTLKNKNTNSEKVYFDTETEMILIPDRNPFLGKQ